jgi:putative acetyltransferase
MRIIEDDLSGPEIAELLTEHLAAMVRNSPPQCVHALDLATLRAPDITFWTAWNKSTLLGCGALKELDPTHGEIKSMRTVDSFLGQGVGSAMLSHLIEIAVRRTYSRLSLETGSGPAFAPALALYEKFGFEYCEPFASYRADPFTRFMTMEL